jgi:DNA-binding XRE family transcriptional regulator
MKNIIYGLRDPRNDVYQYIGKSTVGEQRPLQHLTRSHSPYVNEWVKMLEENWLYPKIDIIEEVKDINDLPDRERYWIDYYYNINPSLFNIMLMPEELVETRSDDDAKSFDDLFRIIHSISSILKRERLCRKLTQQQLSELMGVSRSTLSLLEKGDNVNLAVIQKCVLALKSVDLKTKVIGKRARQN